MDETLGSRIALLRKERGMTQSELARLVRMTRGGVQLWESGKTSPSTEHIISLAEIFQVTSDYLLDVTSEKTVNLELYDEGVQKRAFRLLQFLDGISSLEDR